MWRRHLFPTPYVQRAPGSVTSIGRIATAEPSALVTLRSNPSSPPYLPSIIRAIYRQKSFHSRTPRALRGRPSRAFGNAWFAITPMLRHHLIHPQINEALGRAGHHSIILIADGNYPAWNKR